MSYKIPNPFRYKIQAWEPPAEYIPQTNIEEIKKVFGKNKVIPKHLEELFYETIVNYPELKEAYIFIVENKFYGIQHTLRSYPPMLSLLNKRKDRACPIVINTNKNVPISFYSLSYEQQRGLLAHELAHIVDYTKRTSLQLIGLGAMFCFSKSFVKKLESTTDKIVIKRGDDKYLEEFRKYETKKASYKLYKKVIYGDDTIAGWKAFVFSIKYSVKTAFAFLVALQEMMVLVYVKKIHKKHQG